MAYLGIDLGTSGLRVLLVDAGGVPVASAQARYEVRTPRPGWSEQDPADWIAALDRAVADIKAQSPRLADVSGIGVAGHMHGAVLLDADHTVLRPCILWNDTRSHAEAAALDAQPAFRAQTGNIVFAGFTAPKLDWVRTHEPDVFARIAKVLLPAAFVNLHLTGEAVGDISDAAGSSWLDTGARAWSADLLAATHLGAGQMARLVEGSAPAGALRADLAQGWGISGPVTVAGGAADNAAAACGMGVLGEGQGFVSLGTSGVVLAARDSYAPQADLAVHTFCHAVPDTWYQMGVMLAATDCLNWLSRITGDSPDALTAALGTDLRPPGETLFLPYLSGERTPHNDATLRGGFVGLSSRATRADLTRAVLEGVSFGLRDCLAALHTAGARPKTLHAIGGGTGSRYWVKLLATVLDTPLLVPKGGEYGAALGAARLAMMAVTAQHPAEVCRPPREIEEIAPDPALRPAFEEGHARFRRAHPAFKQIG